MDITGYQPQVIQAHFNCDDEPVYENKIHMMLNHEEIEGSSKNWGEMRQRFITNEFCFKDKTLHKSKNGFTLSLNSVTNPNNKKQQFIKLQKQSNISKLLFKSQQSVSISESEITQLPDTLLKDLACAVGELNNNGPDALKVEQYKMWARQNPR